MKRSFSLTQQYIAYVLLISFFLQSCGGGFDNNPLTPTGEEQIASIHTNTQAILPSVDIDPLAGQALTAQGGHLVTCYEEDGELKADVIMNAPQGFSKIYEGVEVLLEKGAKLSNLPQLDKKVQQRRIQLQPAQGKQPAKVIIYKGVGLMGGGKDKGKGKEKLITGEEEEEEIEGKVERIERKNIPSNEVIQALTHLSQREGNRQYLYAAIQFLAKQSRKGDVRTTIGYFKKLGKLGSINCTKNKKLYQQIVKIQLLYKHIYRSCISKPWIMYKQ